MDIETPKVALVHDFLTQYGGAERVLTAFHELFPQAPVYTLVYDKKKLGRRFSGWNIRTSFIQKLPGGIKFYKRYLPLMPYAAESLDLSNYELILSDSSAFAKGVNAKARHICYCHTPTRYLWGEMDEYLKNYPAAGLLKRYLRTVIKPRDYAAAQKPDVLVANSKTVQERIKRYYERDSEIIYPPVDTEFFRPSAPKRDYYLTGGRLEPYKKFELAVRAFNELRLPLKVVGAGSMGEELKKMAGEHIEFTGRVSDSELRDLYSGAKAFVFPALEDAGISVLESQACGTPVIGFNRGGTAELVSDGRGGILFDTQSAQSIVEAVRRFERSDFEAGSLRALALPYDKEKFKRKILNLCEAEI